MEALTHEDRHQVQQVELDNLNGMHRQELVESDDDCSMTALDMELEGAEAMVATYMGMDAIGSALEHGAGIAALAHVLAANALHLWEEEEAEEVWQRIWRHAVDTFKEAHEA